MAETPQERRARNKKKREANERAIISGVKSIFSSNPKPSSNPRRSDNEARLGKRRSSERTMPVKSQSKNKQKSNKRSASTQTTKKKSTPTVKTSAKPLTGVREGSSSVRPPAVKSAEWRVPPPKSTSKDTPSRRTPMKYKKVTAKPVASSNEASQGKKNEGSERTMSMKSQGRSTIKSSKRPQVISKNRENKSTKSSGASEYYKSIYGKGATKSKASKSKPKASSMLTPQARDSLSSLLSVLGGGERRVPMQYNKSSVSKSKTPLLKSGEGFEQPTAGKSVSKTDEDFEQPKPKGIGLSPTAKKVTPRLNKNKAGTKMGSSSKVMPRGQDDPRDESLPKMVNTPDSSMKAPSLESLPSQKGYGSDNPNPRGETYGDRNDDSTMPDMLDKSTKDEYRKGQYDRVIKNFVSSMFGRG